MREVLLNCPLKAEQGRSWGSFLTASPASSLQDSELRLHTPLPSTSSPSSGSAHLRPTCSRIHFLIQLRDILGAPGVAGPALDASIMLLVSGTTYWHCSVSGTTRRWAWFHQGRGSKPPATNGRRHCYYPIAQIAPRKFTVIPQHRLVSSSSPSFPTGETKKI